MSWQQKNDKQVSYRRISREGKNLLGRAVHSLDFGSNFFGVLNEKGHGKVHDAIAPCELKCQVSADKVVASEQGGSEAFVLVLGNKESEQSLSDFGVLRGAGSLDGIFVDSVLLGQINTLSELAVALVKMRTDAAHFEKLVLFEANGKCNLVEVVVRVDGGSEGNVVLIIDEKGVDSLV